MLVETHSSSFSQYPLCRIELLFAYRWTVPATGKPTKVGCCSSCCRDANGALRYSYLSFLSSTISFYHVYHSVIISFFFLTGPLIMFNAYHIIPVFIVSSLYWYSCVFLCLPLQLLFPSSPRII
jgi:hypothetical protein